MGTETVIIIIVSRCHIVSVVKLNNPLMGTKTSSTTERTSRLVETHIKLNNPLMGTKISISNSFSNSISIAN